VRKGCRGDPRCSCHATPEGPARCGFLLRKTACSLSTPLSSTGDRGDLVRLVRIFSARPDKPPENTKEREGPIDRHRTAEPAHEKAAFSAYSAFSAHLFGKLEGLELHDSDVGIDAGQGVADDLFKPGDGMGSLDDQRAVKIADMGSQQRECPEPDTFR
jgi:hypothetical protein